MRIIALLALVAFATASTGCHTVDVNPKLKKPSVEFTIHRP